VLFGRSAIANCFKCVETFC